MSKICCVCDHFKEDHQAYEDHLNSRIIYKCSICDCHHEFKLLTLIENYSKGLFMTYISPINADNTIYRNKDFNNNKRIQK